MDLSIFLARWFGLFMLIMSAVWIVRREHFNRMTMDLFHNPALLAVTGFVSLMIGVAIAVSHSVWELNYRGLVTVLGYGQILKGIIRVGYPEIARAGVNRFLSGTNYWITLTIIVALGGYLTYAGFSQ